MPAGAVDYLTLAASTVSGAEESALFDTALDPALLNDGVNLLAVEIHQRSGTSSDISFDLELIVSDAPILTRGPYLQTGTPTSVTINWKTDIAADGRVWYGTDPNALTSFVDDPAVLKRHTVTLSGLTPDTTYYYAVGTSTVQIAGGDAQHYFHTAPNPGVAKPTRIWIIGDSGTADTNAAAVRDAYLNYAGARPADLWLMLGDNAYNSGTQNEYQAAVFDMYPTILRNTVVWPTFGNHDALSASSGSQSGPYYNIFVLPTAGEAGGLASGTEAYYSFDYGDIHFICLDSQDSARTVGGAMLTWLEADLAATTATWIIAYFHHPPYTKGSHDSDNASDSGGRMRDMRQNALPILEAGGVDLVLTGHSHSYERSFLLDGHYGLSSTLTSANLIDAGDGRLDGDGAYRKPAAVTGPHEGAVYAVVGSSGKISGGPLNHPAMFISLNQLGSLVLDIDGERLDAAFVRSNGVVRDHFTILKGSAALTGDLNGDCIVDLTDLAILLSAFETSASGDVDFDGDTDLTDLALLLGAFDNQCP
ncbi:MAG: metallophosphoesterase [Planctomycetota bacterium]|nr:MAG: metallophosphoesterase [Planctomycetota bacterium]